MRPTGRALQGSRATDRTVPAGTGTATLAALTLHPSYLVRGVQWAEGEQFHKPQHQVPAGAPTVCHSFIRKGQWEFLGDSTHALAGQNVPLVPLPDWLVR